jgi:hypothetical protein
MNCALDFPCCCSPFRFTLSDIAFLKNGYPIAFLKSLLMRLSKSLRVRPATDEFGIDLRLENWNGNEEN